MMDVGAALGGEISLLAMVATSTFSDFDWQVVRGLNARELRLPEIVNEVEAFRVEAIVHVLAQRGQFDRIYLPANLALHVAERWTEVEDAIERWRALGVTATREDVEETLERSLYALDPDLRPELHEEWDSYRRLRDSA